MRAVFDVDGTLADCSHRLHHIQGPDGDPNRHKDWEGFYKNMEYDLPILPICNLYKALSRDGWWLEIWTGRQEKYQKQTFEWMHCQALPLPHRIRMRPDNDYIQDNRLKLSWYKEYKEGLKKFPNSTRIQFIVEDRPRIVRALREAGATVLAVADKEF